MQLCTFAASATLLFVLLAIAPSAVSASGASPIDSKLECAVCGVVVAEIEGLLAENLTDDEIMTELDLLCAYVPGVANICDDLVSLLPQITSHIAEHVLPNRVCIDLGLCSANITFGRGKDMTPMPVYELDLSKPPAERWCPIWSQPEYVQFVGDIVSLLDSVLPEGALDLLSDIGDAMLLYMHQDYSEEIRGGAPCLNISAGLLAFVQIAYEAQDFCTGVLVQGEKQTFPLHGRNMDLGVGLVLTDSLRNNSFVVNVTQNGKLLYQSVTFPAFVGVLTASRPGAFSLEVNTRYMDQPIYDEYLDIVAAIKLGAHLSTWLTREAMETASTWSDAVTMLSNTPITSFIYYITAGTAAGEGAVIARNRTATQLFEQLDVAKGQWNLVQTNWDQTLGEKEDAPWFDADRNYQAHLSLNRTGEANIDLSSLLDVMSTKPVFNTQTLLTALMAPATGEFQAWQRWCNGACVE